MHPDLQRKLIRLIRTRYSQFVIATHSTEILAETEPTNILILDRNKIESKYAISLPSVQKVIEKIGSAQNLQITRLWHSRRMILVEGKDIKLLKKMQNKISPNSEYPLDIFPNMSIGGWSGWNIAINSTMILKNSMDESIIVYCILDSDYHLPETIKKRQLESVEKHINLHIWQQKEIENYLIVPSLIHRLIHKKSKNNQEEPTIAFIDTIIKGFEEDMEKDVMDSISNEYKNLNKCKSIKDSNTYARGVIAYHREQFGRITSLVSGKEMISRLSEWSKSSFNVSFGVDSLLDEIRINEIEDEIKQVINAIEMCKKF